MPKDSLIILINRNEEFIVPSGGTVLQEGDQVSALVNKANLPQVSEIFSKVKESK
jgi:cell volume regulation protein A